MAHRHSDSWYLVDMECEDNDVITIDVKTGIRQKGTDERRTFRMTFKADSTLPVKTIEIANVG